MNLRRSATINEQAFIRCVLEAADVQDRLASERMRHETFEDLRRTRRWAKRNRIPPKREQ